MSLEQSATAEPPEPTPSRQARSLEPGSLRISDAERHQVAELLRDAAGDGRLTMDELDERLGAVYGAKTYADLVPLTTDLPGAREVLPNAPAPLSPATPAHPRVSPSAVGAATSSVAVFGGASRKGAWTVSEQYTAMAFFGGVELDFREAVFTAPVTTVYANCVFGGVDITVPDDVVVHVSGVPIFGGFEHGTKNAPTSFPPNAPVLEIKGMAIFGGVDVQVKPRAGERRKPRKEIRDS